MGPEAAMVLAVQQLALVAATLTQGQQQQAEAMAQMQLTMQQTQNQQAEAMKAQQPEDGEGGESAAPANKTQLNFVRDTLGLDYGQRFSLNSRGSWAADPENQVPKFYAKYQEAKANGQAARVADTDYADARTVTLDAVVEFMRDPQECAFEAWDSRRQKAGFRAWKQGEETEGWISRDELERQSRPVPKAEAFTV